ncbi:putative F-box protein At3g16210 [Hordeum vulgare subsp. vulgare]|nr:putative F-box protein At3g16210 [Hordeum vulgare subsp. vulgare]
MARVPDDILACVLCHLAPRSLAASRCVCKGWRDLIDGRRLLRTDLLPLSIYGIFFMEIDVLCGDPPRLFANPLTSRRIDPNLGYVEQEEGYDLRIKNHCNGLLLLSGHVVLNPATKQWVRLPPPPPPCAATGMEAFYNDVCLAFDPTVSPDYEVFLIPNIPCNLDPTTTMFTVDSEWPPSPYAIQVFSSRTWTWEERSFLRKGEAAAATIADMQQYRDFQRRYIVYWKGALYVHCPNDSIMRITLSDGVYQVIKSPTGGRLEGSTHLYLGKSNKGVYCALIYGNVQHQLQVWLLDESYGSMEWELMNDINFAPVTAKISLLEHKDAFPNNRKHKDRNLRPWIFLRGNSRDEDVKEGLVEDNAEWDFTKGFIHETQDLKVNWDHTHCVEAYFLGFHPYKEIVFLWMSKKTAVAYDFSSSKVQCLGNLNAHWIGVSFAYTPCWTGELSGKN